MSPFDEEILGTCFKGLPHSILRPQRVPKLSLFRIAIPCLQVEVASATASSLLPLLTVKT